MKAEGIYSEFSHIRHSINTGLVIGGSGASTSDEKKPEVSAFTFSLQLHDLLLRGVPTMHEQRLSERIHAQERQQARRGGKDRKLCVDSIVAHLQRILNTRQGNVLIADDYGVPDFLDFLQTYPGSVRRIEESIRSAIDRYEPRLSGACVTFIPREEDDLDLRFQIIAVLALEGDRQVLLETVVGTDGRIRVRL